VANRFGANSFRFTGTVKLFKSGKSFFRTNSFPWWLFLGGANSDYIKTEYHKQIRILFPESSVTMLKNCGHWLHVEQPESFQKTVPAFLQQNGLL